MLGWEFFISEQVASGSASPQAKQPTLARWKASLEGIDWVNKLVLEGLASDLGGDGYPNRYLILAGVLFRVLEKGVPKHSGPPVFGDDYYLPAGWVGEAKINLEAIKLLDPFTLLVIEAWDQS